MSKTYCVGFLFSTDLQNVVLIKKNRPALQVGKLNGVGGKVEAGESYHDAMVREFSEEAGVLVPKWELFHTEVYYETNNTVKFFTAVHERVKLVKLTDEDPNWFHLNKWPQLPHMYNLKYLVPMALTWHEFVDHHYSET